jgi:acetyl esterase/lipase
MLFSLLVSNMAKSRRGVFGWMALCVAVLATAPAGGSEIRPATRPSRGGFHQWIPAGFHAVRDVPYVVHAGRSRMLDVYLPNRRTAPRPLLVWIHGGAWESGDKSFPPGLGMLPRGYVVASINYRLSREAVFPAQIYDCKAAVRFLRAHAAEFDVDPSRIGAWGCSAGGQLAALLGTTNGLKEYEGSEGWASESSNVEAVCDWFGPSDFMQWKGLTGPGVTVVDRYLGGVVSANSVTARLASPAEQAGRCAAVPFLIMHGDQDATVPAGQSQILFARLRRAGAPVRLVVLPHAGHGNGWFEDPRDLLMVYDFFDRSLRSPILHRLPKTGP